MSYSRFTIAAVIVIAADMVVNTAAAVVDACSRVRIIEGREPPFELCAQLLC
jgi:hypothetical protein